MRERPFKDAYVPGDAAGAQDTRTRLRRGASRAGSLIVSSATGSRGARLKGPTQGVPGVHGGPWGSQSAGSKAREIASSESFSEAFEYSGVVRAFPLRASAPYTQVA